MPLRRALGYPPARRLLRLGVSGRKQGETEQAAHGLAEALRQNLGSREVAILGPAPAVFPRLNDRFRYQILIKGTLDRESKRWLIKVLASLKESYRAVEAMHDVDPVSVY